MCIVLWCRVYRLNDWPYRMAALGVGNGKYYTVIPYEISTYERKKIPQPNTLVFRLISLLELTGLICLTAYDIRFSKSLKKTIIGRCRPSLYLYRCVMSNASFIVRFFGLFNESFGILETTITSELGNMNNVTN